MADAAVASAIIKTGARNSLIYEASERKLGFQGCTVLSGISILTILNQKQINGKSRE